MALQTPIIKEIKPFPATEEYTFEFYYNGDNQAVKNNLVIEDNSDGTVVYDSIIDTFQLSHPVTANTLTNGTEYRCKVRVADVNSNWSSFSEYEVFWVLSDPIITIDTIDENNKVYNQTVNFSSTYSQSEGELLESYRYILYDSNKNIIESFPEQFSDGSTALTQEITGLDNGYLYYLEVKTLSVNGQEGTSGLIQFTPQYLTPKLSATLTVENKKEQGAIRLTSQIVQLIGQIDSGTVSYVNDEEIDLTNGEVSFQDGFNMSGSDFILKLWFKDIPDNVVFLKLVANEGYIELIKYNNCIHAFKQNYNSTNKAHFVSNQLTMNAGTPYMLYMKQINQLIGLSLQTV